MLANIAMAKPSHSIPNKVAILLGVRLTIPAIGAGTAVAACYCDSAGNVIISGLMVTVTDSGGNIKLNSVAIGVGETITITSLTLTHPSCRQGGG